jgi:hypothetical protein
MNIKKLSTPSLLFASISLTTNLLSLFIAPYRCNLDPYSCGIILLCSIVLTLILIYFITWFIDTLYLSQRFIFSWFLAIFFIYFNLSEFYSLNINIYKNGSSNTANNVPITSETVFVEKNGNITSIPTTSTTSVNQESDLDEKSE